MRNKSKFLALLKEATHEAALDGFTIPMRMKHSRKDDEENTEFTEDYFRRVLIFPCLDELIK